MIRIEIVGETIADFRQKLETIFWSLSGRDQPPSTQYGAPVPGVDKLGFDPILPEGMVAIPMEKPAEPKVVKRRATKGAGSEPEVVAPQVAVVLRNLRQEAHPGQSPRPEVVEQATSGVLVEEVTAAMVRESLLALLQIGDDEPEVVLAAFQVKKISLLKPEEFAAVKAAADKRLTEWQDAK